MPLHGILQETPEHPTRSRYYKDYAQEMQGLASALNVSVGEIAARWRER